MVDERHPLQQKILLTVAQNESPIIVQKIAELLDRSAPAILESIKPLFERHFLTSEQEVIRGKRLIRLTDLGAIWVIASFSELPYTTIYRNHPYLKMPEILQDVADCTIDDRSKSELISAFALKLIMFGPSNLFSVGHADLSYNSRYSHHLGALLLDTIQVFLSKDENPQLINYEKVRVLLDRAREMYDNSFERIATKIGNYDAVIKGERVQKRDEHKEFKDSQEAFRHIMETLQKTDPELYKQGMELLQKEYEARAMKSKAPARKRQS